MSLRKRLQKAERLEALGHGVVVGAAGAAHTGLDARGLEASDVVSAGALHAARGCECSRAGSAGDSNSPNPSICAGMMIVALDKTQRGYDTT